MSDTQQNIGGHEGGTAVAEAPAPVAAPAPRSAPAPVAPALQTAPAPRGEAKFGYWWGTGRRKSAVARVRVKPGEGKFLINDRPYDKFFTEARDRHDVCEPLTATKTDGKVDVLVNVEGGGYMGQAGAVRLGLSRALMAYDPTLEPILRDHNMLTRDPREVERKKYGQPGARRRFQFSKR